MKAYVITQGCYSDYHICAVTLDKEKAERLRKLALCHDSDYVEIEEYELDKIEYEFTPEALETEPIRYYRVEINYSVNEHRVTRIEAFEQYKTGDRAVFKISDESIGVYEYRHDKPIWYEVNVREDSEEKAKKIAIDRFYIKLNEKYIDVIGGK